MNEPAMTIPEQAVEAATKALAPHISGFKLDMLSPHQQKDISETARLVLSAALPFMGVERAALPPLRAREEKPACPESDSWFEAKIAEPKPIVAEKREKS